MLLTALLSPDPSRREISRLKRKYKTLKVDVQEQRKLAEEQRKQMVALNLKLMHWQYTITPANKVADLALTRSTENLVQVMQRLSPLSLADLKRLDDLPAGFTPCPIRASAKRHKSGRKGSRLDLESQVQESYTAFFRGFSESYYFDTSASGYLTQLTGKIDCVWMHDLVVCWGLLVKYAEVKARLSGSGNEIRWRGSD